MVKNLKGIADIKEQEANILTNYTIPGHDGSQYNAGYLKVMREVQLLDQRFQLGDKDNRIKAEIIQSKEFQNALTEVQVNWMKDGTITSQHVYQGIMQILLKLMSPGTGF